MPSCGLLTPPLWARWDRQPGRHQSEPGRGPGRALATRYLTFRRRALALCWDPGIRASVWSNLQPEHRTFLAQSCSSGGPEDSPWAGKLGQRRRGGWVPDTRAVPGSLGPPGEQTSPRQPHSHPAHMHAQTHTHTRKHILIHPHTLTRTQACSSTPTPHTLTHTITHLRHTHVDTQPQTHTLMWTHYVHPHTVIQSYQVGPHTVTHSHSHTHMHALPSPLHLWDVRPARPLPAQY